MTSSHTASTSRMPRQWQARTRYARSAPTATPTARCNIKKSTNCGCRSTLATAFAITAA